MTTTKVRLSDNAVVWLDNVDVAVEREVAAKGGVERQFAEALPAVRSVCRDLETLISELGPTKATVEFGVGFKVETSGLAVVIAKGNVAANFGIKLEWERR